jgi:signal transduction histidine kinase
VAASAFLLIVGRASMMGTGGYGRGGGPGGGEAERADRRRAAALRRVAILVGGVVLPEEVFGAIAAEAGRLLDAEFAVLSRYQPDGAATIVGRWASPGAELPVPAGFHMRYEDITAQSRMFRTRRPVRIDDYGDTRGEVVDLIRKIGVRSTVGVPVSVENQLWGAISVASTREEPLPADTEVRLAEFTELVATAIANAQAHLDLRGYANEQAALRRVATLVARAAAPQEVFAAVTAEIGQLLEVDFTVLGRREPDGGMTVLGAWARIDPGRPLPVGLRLKSGGHNIHTLVFHTREPARIDYGNASGHAADVAREWGFRSAVGAPISVEDRMWGVVVAGSAREEPLAPGTETRLAGFTELVGTAVANAEAQAALTASRARIAVAADTARRRIERDLHDGAQQHLVSLTLQLRTVQAVVAPAATDLAAELDDVADGLTAVLDELREIARGIHPAVLAEGGLRPALKALARRSSVPVRLDIQTRARFGEPTEIAAYYAVSEALTNAAKHGDATTVTIQVTVHNGVLDVSIHDNGHGGADPARGSGLVGLTDRIETLGGHLWLHSPLGAGTTLRLALPLTAPSTPRPHSRPAAAT